MGWLFHRTIPEETPQPRDHSKWDDWLNGDTWSFDQGTDFNDTPLFFIKQLRYRAKLKGMRIHVIEHTEDMVTMNAFRPEIKS